MKTRKNKVTNLFKTGILFFGISLLLWNCESNEEITFQGDFQGFEPIGIQEAQNTIGEIIDKKGDLYRKGSSSLTIDESSLNYIDVENTSLSLPSFSASLNEKVNTKVFMVKKEGIVYTCLYHSIPFEDATNSDAFSGRIIITTIDGEFINGYKVEEGVFVSQYKVKKQENTAGKTFQRPPDSSDYECKDYGTDFCDQELDEVVITSSGGGNNGYSYVYIYTNPVSSQGWMNLNLSGNNTSGGGGGTNSGNGGNSNDGEMPLFNCDNPTPRGCEEEEDDQIFNELTGKDKCVYDKLKSLSLFKQTIGKFSKGNYDLTFKYGSKCNDGLGEEACTDASDLHNGNITIKILGSGTQSLDFAATLLHEGIHAEIYKYVDEHKKGIDPNNRKSVFHYYNYYSAKNNDRFETSIAQHQHMQDVFVIPIAKAIRQLDNYRLPLENYYGFGWEGLKEDYDYDNYIDINGKVQVMTPNKYRDYINKMYNVISTTKFKDILKNCN